MSKNQEKICVYAGSFDPLTEGHMWVIRESAKIFDKLIVSIGDNAAKKTEYTLKERKEMLRQAVAKCSNVQVESFQGLLLINYAKSVHANYIVRGIRSEQDFSFEKGIFHINRDIDSEITNIFLIPPKELIDISSSMVKGLIGFKNWESAVEKYVPASAFKIIKRREEEKCIVKKLKKRWINLFGNLGVFDAGRIANYFNEVIAHYTKECRNFHNVWHLKKCFDEFDEIKGKIANVNILELSIFFHDVIYIPEAKDNEQQSADYLKHVLRQFYFDETWIKTAQSYILFTKHVENPDDQDGKYLVDIDLCVFGYSTEEFAQYEKNIRKEYSDFSKEKYLTGRIKVVEKFLEKGNIYQADYFRNKYEKQALVNLSGLLEELKSQQN